MHIYQGFLLAENYECQVSHLHKDSPADIVESSWDPSVVHIVSYFSCWNSIGAAAWLTVGNGTSYRGSTEQHQLSFLLNSAIKSIQSHAPIIHTLRLELKDAGKTHELPIN